MAAYRQLAAALLLALAALASAQINVKVRPATAQPPWVVPDGLRLAGSSATGTACGTAALPGRKVGQGSGVASSPPYAVKCLYQYSSDGPLSRRTVRTPCSHGHPPSQ